ncbi:ATP-binding cassette domain-containing protein [Thaumasiovibrio sp. DFM-14]|uniref:ATP-binding cassette domain-containing protein n=1 Tax=Thaumasiovibrio sp. DFM-14 TaxID=3384792 RepID=UPI00399FE9A1
MLSVNNLSVFSVQQQLVKEVSFQVSAGECVGMVGASGSGKSILAHALLDSVPLGFTRRGNIKTDCRIALIPQSGSYLNPTAKVGQQLMALAVSESLLASVIDHYQLDALLPLYPGQLSGGMTKRVLCAIAMVQDSQLVIADEPTAGVDSRRSAEMLRGLAGFAQEGKGVMVISHDIAALAPIVDRLLVFRQGELVDETNLSQILLEQCHPYTQSLWQAAPENWLSRALEEPRYAKTA